MELNETEIVAEYIGKDCASIVDDYLNYELPYLHEVKITPMLKTIKRAMEVVHLHENGVQTMELNQLEDIVAACDAVLRIYGTISKDVEVLEELVA